MRFFSSLVILDDTRYRSKLKSRLKSEFGDQISFLKSENNLPEIVIATDCLTSTSFQHDQSQIVIKAAKILRNEIQNKFKDRPQPKWPPTEKELENEAFKPPTNLLSFIETILTGSTERKSRSKKIVRLAQSISQDIVFNCCQGKVLQHKHFLLGLGVHNLTGSRKIVDILNKLGHCINYNMVCDIETSQAELVQEEASSKCVLPIEPSTPTESIWTHFWVDNFDIKVDKEVGGGSLHTTHLMAFQEHNCEAAVRPTTKSFLRPKNRKIFLQDVNISTISVDRKINPPTNFFQRPPMTDDADFNKRYLFWTFLRKQMSCNQTIPVFKGWSLQERMEPQQLLAKTIETYLPPINSKVTEFTTINKYLRYLQDLADKMNMPYVHVSLDVGAAMNAYLLIWNNPEMFKNVVIHLGSFHFLKENFQVSI